MLDFTSAKYLGFEHPRAALGDWRELTSGRPAILDIDGEAAALERGLARLSGSAAAVLSPSSLHALWDVVALAHGLGFTFLVEQGTYPVALAALDHARARGRRLGVFAHHDPDALARALSRQEGHPLILADGVCPTCGRAAPLDAYARAARDRGGLLVIDDTQGFGLLGPHGAGAARSAGADPQATIVVASLAKAFGAPLSFTSGPAWFIERLRDDGHMRTHGSPPNAASIRAGHAALRLNREIGAGARERLVTNIETFRWVLAQSALRPRGAPFPVQSLATFDSTAALRAKGALAARGIRAIVTTSRCPPRQALLTFMITAAHTPDGAARGAGEAADALSRPGERTHSSGARSP